MSGRKKEQRNRSDYTKERNRFERRLDSLANLLSGSSECVAVSIVEGVFFIAANEFSSEKLKKLEKQHYDFIVEVMLHFQKIATGKTVDEITNKEIFKKICLLRIKKFGKINLIIPNNLTGQIINDVLNQSNLAISYFSEKYGKNTKAALVLYKEFNDVYKDFTKIKTSLASIESENEQFEELRGAFNAKYRILQDELIAGVHAEMQILSHIVRGFSYDQNASEEQKIYIGISKLCCLHCRCMLEQANNVFKESQPSIPIIISVRGQHDLHFEKWICPSVFSIGYEENEESSYELSEELDESIKTSLEAFEKSRVSEEVEESEKIAEPEELQQFESSQEFEKTKKNIVDEIGRKSFKAIKDLINNTKGPSKTIMSASESSSEDEEELIKRNIRDRLVFFETTINFLEKVKEDSVVSNLKMLHMAKTLHASEVFIKFCQMPATKNKATFFYVLEELVNASIPNYSSAIFLAVLQDANFVGETVAKYFRNFHLDQIQEGHKFIEQTPVSSTAFSSSVSDSESSSGSSSPKLILKKLGKRYLDEYPELIPDTKRFKTRENYQTLLDEIFEKFSSEEAQLEQALKASASTMLKEQAEQLGFTIVDVAGDGNCFFHAVVDQIHYAHHIGAADLVDLQELTHQQLRERAIAHLLDHQEDYQEFIAETDAQDFNSFIEKLMQGGEWADHVIIAALSRALNINLDIIRSDAAPSNTIPVENPRATLHLAYVVGLHYQSLHRAEPAIEARTLPFLGR